MLYYVLLQYWQRGGSHYAAIIANYAKEAIERFFKAGIIGGYPDGSMKLKGEATCAEVAAMIMRFLEAME